MMYVYASEAEEFIGHNHFCCSICALTRYASYIETSILCKFVLHIIWGTLMVLGNIIAVNGTKNKAA